MPALADNRHYSYRDHEHERGRDRDRDREHFRRTSPPLAIVPGSPGRRPIQSSSGALLSLSQDITALVSLSFEATFSLVNDYVRAALGTVGVGHYMRVDPTRSSTDTGSGLAVVVVGAADRKCCVIQLTDLQPPDRVSPCASRRVATPSFP